MKFAAGITIVVAALVLVPRPAAAQDPKWEPWLGCWDLVNENSRVGEGAARASALSGDPDAGAIRGTSPRVCVTRVPNGVKLTTTVPDQPPVEQTLIADGSAQPITEGGCVGTGKTEWSASGDRLFINASVNCDDGRSREISGMGLMAPDGTWLDIRSFSVAGSTTTRVSRYERALESRAVRRPPAVPMTLADIKEAAGKTSSTVLEAAIAETRPRVPVNRQTLTDLADSGVPGNVTDVVVALAYPDRFVVERSRGGYAGSAPFGIDDYYYSGRFYPAYYYSPFAFSYIGLYDPFLYGGGGILVPANPGGGGGSVPQPSGVGRVVNGSGYTRIREADASQDSGGEASGATARPRSGGNTTRSVASDGGSSTSSSGNSGSSSSGSSGGDSGGGGSSSSPGGFSGGGDSGGGGRTAVPR
jgi:hypothetical protein